MGLFQQRDEEEQKQWAGLPSEPRDTDAVDRLDAAPSVDPLTLGLGLGDTAAVSSIVFPVTPPPPAAVSIENHEPEPDAD